MVEEFTEQHAALIVEAAERLLSVCDGAVDEDGQGFNKPDSLRVRKLLSGYSLDATDLKDLHTRLRKYKSQLSGWGIDYDALPVPPLDARHELREKPVTVVVAKHPVHDSCKLVTFTFGKYSGKTLYEVATDKSGRGYLQWISEQPTFRQPWLGYAKAALAGDAIEVTEEVRAQQRSADEVSITDIGKGWFAAKFPKALKDDFKEKIDGRRWNGDLFRWEIPALSVARAFQFFQDRGIPVTLDAEAKRVRDEEISRRASLDATRGKEDTALIIDGLLLELFGYQNVGVEFIVRSGGRAIIADEMGLGKTVQFIAFVLYRRMTNPNYRALVLCPAAVLINWEREIKKFTGLDACLWTTRGPQGDLGAAFHVCAYSSLIVRTDSYPVVTELNKIGFDGIGADEYHLLKSRDAQRTQAVMGAGRKGDSKKYPGLTCTDFVGLTGTPIQNRPAELFTLLNHIDAKRFPSFFHYANRYGAWPKGNWAGRPSTPMNLDDLHERTKDIVIRRLQKDVQKDMPPLLRTEAYIELSEAERKEYTKLLLSLVGTWKKSRKPSVTDYHAFNEFLIDKKLPRAWELIDEMVENGHSVLVFSTRLAPLKKTMERYGSKGALITGEMSLQKRQESIDRIQSGEAVVGCLSLLAAGVGINLPRADRVIFLDMDWVPANHLQAQKRAHRTGQINTVLVTYLLVANTTDDLRRDDFYGKLALAEAVIDGKVVTKKREATLFAKFLRKLKKHIKEAEDLEEVDETEEVGA